MDILNYVSKIWGSADLLISAGVKQSDFPNFMMPFFALRLVESRLLRKRRELMQENNIDEEHIQDIIEIFQDESVGYNDVLIKDNIKLADIVSNTNTFDADFQKYLESFDQNTRHLLGCKVKNNDEKFLNLDGIISELKGKKILFGFVSAWAQIDLEPFNNSEITTLEEHIKRRWADVSASTAGEQYTPDDIISLISEIVIDKAKFANHQYVHIYDPTCGGGNLLFGIEDRIREHFNNSVFTATYGMDYNSQLYALSKIESLFRGDSHIYYGNTLTDITFGDQVFDIVVANPPYGLTWSGFKKEIDGDQTGRFHALPSISDSQMLFDQHIAHYMKDDGIAVIVNNGSPLFSGDAGSGESEIRKYFFDKDWVEALIQMPANEFFNTGIYTYLWVLNKNKAADRKDKVILINGSLLYETLKKSKGNKRNTMNDNHRAQIVEALHQFRDSDIAKVYDKWFCYYNKFSITLFDVDNDGKAFCDFTSENTWNGLQMPVFKSIKISPYQYETESGEIMYDTTFVNSDDKASWLADAQQDIYPLAQNVSMVYDTPSHYYYYNAEAKTIVEVIDGASKSLGFGVIRPEWKYKKATTKSKKITELVDSKKVKKNVVVREHEQLILSFVIESSTENDYELVPYNPDDAQNRQDITDFMDKYVSRPWSCRKNDIGTEINFNKIFYTPEPLRPADDILADIRNIDSELKQFESQFEI